MDEDSSFTKFRTKTISAEGQERVAKNNVHDTPEPLQIPKEATAFNLSATFAKCLAGPYRVYWKVRVREVDEESTGVHFTAEVSYSAEADPGSSCDVSMNETELKDLENLKKWCDLEIEEIIIVQPHIGTATVELHFCNKEVNEGATIPVLDVERVELRPLFSSRDPDPNVSLKMVQRATQSKPTTTRPSTNDDAPITRLAVSKCSTYIASLSIKADIAYIAITNTGDSHGNSSSNMREERVEVEEVVIGDLSARSIGLAISVSGDQIAIYQEPNIGAWQVGSIVSGDFPFAIYDNPLVPRSHGHLERANTMNSISVKKMGKIKNIPDSLKGFIGYCAFLESGRQAHDSKASNISDTYDYSQYTNLSSGGISKSPQKTKFDSKYESKFVACNGLYLDIYGIDSKRDWTWSHSISLVNLVPTISRRITCRTMMSMISPNLFMWLEDGGICCTVWDLYTGINVSYISASEKGYMGKETRYNKMTISPSESIIALAASNGTLTTFDTVTGLPINTRVFFGIKIEHIEFHGKDDQLLVILRDSDSIELSSRILDPLLLVSEVGTCQLPVPVIGSTILAFFNTDNLSGKGITCEAYGSKINYYESQQLGHQAIDLTSKHAIQISGDDTDLQGPVIHSIYDLKVGYHRVHLPERLHERYWVHHVSVNYGSVSCFKFIPEPWMRTRTTKALDPNTVMRAYFLPDKTRFVVVGMQTLQIWMLPTKKDPEYRLAFIWGRQKEKDKINDIDEENRERVEKYYQDISGVVIIMDESTGVTEASITIDDVKLSKNIAVSGPEFKSDFKPGTIGMRHAIKPCFETIHLLADAHNFCMSEKDKARQLKRKEKFHYMEHANAIIRFTKVFLNRRIPSDNALFIPDFGSQSSQDIDSRSRDTSNTKRNIEYNLESQLEINRKTLLTRILKWKTRSKYDQVTKDHSEGEVRYVTLLTTLLDHTKFRRANYEFVKSLLKATGGCWVPSNAPDLNPLGQVLKVGARPLIEAIIDYSVKNAKQYHPAYLLPVMQYLKELSADYPDLVNHMFKMSSYTPAPNHGTLANHAEIASFNLSNNLDDYKKPVFSLRYRLDVFQSELLRNSSMHSVSNFPNTESENKTLKKKQASLFTHKVFVCPYPTLSTLEESGKEESAFTSIAGKDFFDSPAMKATLRFKWNRYAFYYWFFRFLFVLSFITLIVAFTIKQVIVTKTPRAGDVPDVIQYYLLDFRWILIVAIVIGSILLLYEVFQFLVDWKKYIRSFYNAVDLLTYGSSIVGALLFLHSTPTGVDDGGPHQNTPLSFALLLLTLTLLFELRVFKQFGIVVNLIIEISKEVAVFCLVFLTFIVGFTFALQHLLHTRRFYLDCAHNPECPEDYMNNTYPPEYYNALVDTFFFLGGRYEPIGESLDHGSASLRAMMLIFYLITVILFLNILIAFMNDAYNDCRNQGEVGWLIHLSDVINEVERVMVQKVSQVNGKYFPDYIYYYATEQDAIDYEARHQIPNKSKLSPESRYLYDSISDISKKLDVEDHFIVECNCERDCEGDCEGDYERDCERDSRRDCNSANGDSMPTSPVVTSPDQEMTVNEETLKRRRNFKQLVMAAMDSPSQSRQSSFSRAKINDKPIKTYTMEKIVQNEEISSTRDSQGYENPNLHQTSL